ncbi:MAG: polysaccharide biosynthesis C-terminal domain-containing protein [Bacteroidota bacterium]
MSTLKRFFKDTIIYGIAAVLPRAINILLVKLHTNALQSEKFAVNTLYFVYAAYFNAFLTYGMETAFFRFFTKEKEKGKVISTSFISILTTTILFLFFTLIFSVELSVFFGFDNPIYLQILILVTTFDTLLVIPYAYLRVKNQPIRFAFYKILNITIYALLNLVFLMYLPKAIENGSYAPQYFIDIYNQYPLVIFIFIANLIASVITFILLIPIIFQFKFDFDIALLKKMLKYAFPLLIASLAYVTNENLDKILLDRMIGKEQMGIYAACYKLGVFMILYIMAFRLGAEPFFFNQATKNNAKETYAKVLKWFTVLGTITILIIINYIDVFANMLLGKAEYFSALNIVPIILLSNLFLGIYYNLAIWYKLTDKTKYAMYFSVFGAIVTILINIIFIPEYGYMASAWATLIAYVSMTLASYFYGKKNYPIPYEAKNILFYIIISFILSMISFSFFRQNYQISTIILVLFILTIYIKEKTELQNIFKK